jgi:hypothetical protein
MNHALILGPHSSERVWILGSRDPEMMAIEDLLNQYHETFTYALSEKDGHRVYPSGKYPHYKPCMEPPYGHHPTNAYEAKDSAAVVSAKRIYLVECDFPQKTDSKITWPTSSEDVIRIGHHRPEDSGFGKKPENFMEASSIGQVISELAKLYRLRDIFLGFWPQTQDLRADLVGRFSYLQYDWKITINHFLLAHVPMEYVFTAASDHCLLAAYDEQCYGIGREELLAFRCHQKAVYYNGLSLDPALEPCRSRSQFDVVYDVHQAQGALRRAKRIEIAPKCFVRDMRGAHERELREAAIAYDYAYINSPRGSHVVELDGRTTPEMVEAFVNEWAPKNGFPEATKGPSAGFAHAYTGNSPSLQGNETK